VYHLFVDGDCVCNTQKKECDVSHWLKDETITDGSLCAECYQRAAGYGTSPTTENSVG
jgi:hypothetical protein